MSWGSHSHVFMIPACPKAREELFLGSTQTNPSAGRGSQGLKSSLFSNGQTSTSDGIQMTTAV